MPSYPAQCTRCIHSYRTFDPVNNKPDTCPAYPSGIPHDTFFGMDRHDKKRNDQKGDYVFEAESIKLPEKT